MHSFGVYQFGNGHRYEGAWHEERMQGFGMYTFRTGEAQSGQWQNGVLDVLNSENGLHGSLYTVSHSKVLYVVQVFNEPTIYLMSYKVYAYLGTDVVWLLTVQEAQRAAGKAYVVARLDERVNKTIAAAKKVANVVRIIVVKAVQRQMPLDNSDNEPNPYA
ncbi:uncharacterized protein LOC110639401 [Hevea brasiliensis]|uniref:uncharacterized protein LOC110639401 n=1 Tax=Hevea brasiliensis TaxID=3981 RepID=UPI0025F96DB1|nr:uncharacterized protein LOC110639401 [Hevea brasiliensis]